MPQDRRGIGRTTAETAAHRQTLSMLIFAPLPVGRRPLSAAVLSTTVLRERSGYLHVPRLQRG